MSKRSLVAVGFLMLGLVGVASADISGTVVFTDPVVNVQSNVAIPIFLTLTMTGDPLITDGSANVTTLTQTQIDANLFNNLPAGVNPDTDALFTFPNETLSCSGTFFQGCGGGGNGGPYDFTFATGAGSFFGATNLDLEPGVPTTFLFGTFTPEGGNAPAGTYNLPGAQYEIQVYDSTVLTDGFATHIADIPLGNTFDSAGFTANVTAANVTPEPGFFGLIALALPVLVFFAWRRRSAARANA